MSCTTTNTILLSAANIIWGVRNRTCVEFLSEGDGAYNGTYFTFDAPSSHGGPSVSYYVWFDLNGGSVDPAIAGATGIEVNVTSADSASVIATSFVAAVDAIPDLLAVVNPNDATSAFMDSFFVGNVDNQATDVDTTLMLHNVNVGVGGDLGKTQGGIEVAFEQESVDITADQTGGVILDSVIRGAAVSVSMSLLEMTPERWKTVVGSVSGDSFTPVGGTEVVGFGESRVYQSLFDLGGLLIMHPTRFPDSNKTYDITLFKSAPLPESINFSGEEPQLMAVSFRGLADREINSAVNILAFGDSTQDLRI